MAPHSPAVPTGIPPADVEVDKRMVAGLLARQHPDLARLPLKRVAHGWDNHLFRLGDDLAVRLPRHREAVDLLLKEQHWLPGLARQLPLPVSTPVRTGQPGPGYPWPWSVVPWLAGVTAGQCRPDPTEAAHFGRILRSLHQPAPHGAPRNPLRGVPLAQRNETVETLFKQIAEAKAEPGVPLRHLRSEWQLAVSAPIDVPDTWIHGDLHPKNVIVQDGRLAGVIDWGDLCAGDAATDLSAIWFLFDDVDGVLAAYGGISEATRQRTRGWAVFFGLVFLATAPQGTDDYAPLGRRMLRRVLGLPEEIQA